jgi:hypothetical protein
LRAKGVIEKPYTHCCTVKFEGENVRRRRMRIIRIMGSIISIIFLFAASSIFAQSALPQFGTYPVTEIFKGKPAAPDFKTDPDAKRFVTLIQDGAKKGPNFAGHYTLISWGCGTMCQSFIIIDSVNGKIYPSPFTTETGVCYRLDSSLLILNPITPDVVEDGKVPEWLTTGYYNWSGGKLVLIKESKLILQDINCNWSIK